MRRVDVGEGGNGGGGAVGYEAGDARARPSLPHLSPPGERSKATQRPGQPPEALVKTGIHHCLSPLRLRLPNLNSSCPQAPKVSGIWEGRNKPSQIYPGSRSAPHTCPHLLRPPHGGCPKQAGEWRGGKEMAQAIFAPAPPVPQPPFHRSCPPRSPRPALPSPPSNPANTFSPFTPPPRPSSSRKSHLWLRAGQFGDSKAGAVNLTRTELDLGRERLGAGAEADPGSPSPGPDPNPPGFPRIRHTRMGPGTGGPMQSRPPNEGQGDSAPARE